MQTGTSKSCWTVVKVAIVYSWNTRREKKEYGGYEYMKQ